MRFERGAAMKFRRPVRLRVNGQNYDLLVEPRETLLEVLRERLGLTGTKEGCGNGNCGACTVLLNGKPVNSCLVLAVEVEGDEVLTIEGLARDGALDALQQAFIEEGAIQCGFCTPGLILTAWAFLRENPRPREGEVKKAIAGNLCRCTGYHKIVRAILTAVR